MLGHERSVVAMSSESTDSGINEYLQDVVLESSDVSLFLDELCRHAVRSLSDGEQMLCGITLLRERKATTVASSSTRAREMDEVQYKFDTGPCLSAAREQVVMDVADVHREQRWPGYIAAIGGYGVHSILAVPFSLADDAKAALNLYSDTANTFTDEGIERARAYAGEASRSLRLAVRIAQLSETAENLKSAMESRTIIDIAVGIIMCQSRCSQAEAFTFLQRASSHRNVKLREIARQIVDGHGANPEPRTHFDD